MKNFSKLLWIVLTIMLFQIKVYSQPGSSCSTPYAISTLPFVQTGMTTAGFPDTFDNTDACASDYMTGNDFVFSYSPASDQYVNITLTNTGNAVGLFVVDDCPDQPGTSCIASAESLLGNPSVSNVMLDAGTTYYIIVSTMDPIYILPNPSTAFDIQIDVINPYDMAIIQIVSPLSGCALTASEEITIELANNGLLPVDSVLIEYSIDGSTPVTDTVYDLIMPDSTLFFTFSAHGNFSVVNTTYQLSVYTKVADNSPLNDTAVALLTNSQVISTFPYHEDFETGNGGYGSSGSSSSWAWGSPSKPIITHAASPTKCWVTGLQTNYNQGEASYLNFPCLDFSGLTAPVLEFNLWVATTGITDYCRVEYSADNGNTWETLGQQNDPINWYDGANGWTSPGNDFITVRHRVDSLAGNPNAKLRIFFYGSLITQSDGIAVDDISIYQAPANDIGITQILYPGTSCGLTSNEHIQVTIENFGTTVQSNFNIGFSINGIAMAPEVVTSALNPGTSMQYTFTTPANLGAVQQYQIKCYTSLVTDTDHSNDTSSISINNMLAINTFPYLEDFESSDGGWVGGGLNSSWAWGTPVKPIINHAASPTKCWVTNLTTNANMLEMSNLTGPCFDFSSLNVPEIEFNIWYATSSMAPGTDSIILQVSIDSGATWTRVGNMFEPNWYNTPYGWSGNLSNWTHVRHTLDSAGGEPNVRLRLYYYGPYATICEGVAIDDIYIHEAPANDLGVTTLQSPQSGCNLGNQEYVGVLFSNFGQNAQSHFPISYQINSGAWVTDTINMPIYSNETIFYSFTQTADLSAIGDYVFKITTGLANDEDHANDTVTVTITNSAGVSVFPYSEDFESGDGGWYTEGTSSWAYGVPASALINTAHSPSMAWKTNLSGYTLGNEESYLYSPCFDFTGYNNPVIELYVWHETMMMMGATAVLEASIDGGMSWAVVGPNETNNWYVASFTGGNSWNGSSAGWVYKTHALDFCGNQSGVKLRIHYLHGQFSMTPEEGIAVDDIHIFDCTVPVPGFTYSANGTQVNFTNTSTGATGYLWRFGDGTTGTVADANHTYPAPGTYAVTLVAYSDCTADSVTQYINITAGGIDDYQTEKNIVCQPNPSNGVFNLIISNNHCDDITLDIYQINGSSVYQDRITDNSKIISKQIDITAFEKGVYYMRLSGKNLNVVRKIVLE
ncbi:MAG TPA: PKD domain-containing protein [Bacteroidales bacterium]|nr:PKD domain-containing protein [Bacteroidales bacterium]